jgi:ABC-2 type transport system permease protein
MKKIKKIGKIYWLLSLYAIESAIATRWAMAIFIFGKLFRMGVFLFFTLFLFRGTGGVLNYSQNESLLFVVYFYFVSAAAQMFFREAYRFRPRLISGEFDYDLIRPVHPVLRCLLGGFDLHDLLTLPFLALALGKAVALFSFGAGEIALLFLLTINAIVGLFAFHLLFAAWMIIFPDVDHGLMMYRDLETMGRFPVDIYREPLKTALTFVFPVGLAFTLPVKSFLGLVSWPVVLFSFMIGVAMLTVGFKFWDFAVKKYSSASS